jgi:hypothetical protein
MLKWNIKAAVSGMRVGDSFFVPCLDCKHLEGKIRRVAREFGYTFQIKNVTEEFVKGLRAWRVR